METASEVCLHPAKRALGEVNRGVNRGPPSTAGACSQKFVVDFDVNSSLGGGNRDGESGNERENLQAAFMKFREQRQADLRRAKIMKKRELENRRDEARMQALRRKFVETAKGYYGVPYAKRYHKPGTPMYNSPLFLDCCGLVRRVMKDLKEDFGFSLGPWNQAYMFDLLPNKLNGPEDMQPGDLVFVTAVYNNPKAKQQKHHVVHVEIWAGEGEKTIGARWGKSSVEMHDHYTYISTSYHGMKYHFRSIDTWLQGICKSYCPEYAWQLSKFQPGKRSIFYSEEMSDDEQDAEPSLEEDDDEEEKSLEMSKSTQNQQCCHHSVGVSEHHTLPVKCCPTDSSSGAQPSSSSDSTTSGGRGGQGAAASAAASKGLSPKSPSKRRRLTQGSRLSQRRLAADTSRQVLTFYIGGHNGVGLVEAALLPRGWVKISDPNNTNFRLRWTEVKSQINYREFKPGEQMVNHIPNIGLLTTKTGLLMSLREHCRCLARSYESGLSKQRPIQLSDIVPETFNVELQAEREQFLQTFQDGEIWICKPAAWNQGKGIFLVRDIATFIEKFAAPRPRTAGAERSHIGRSQNSYVIQRYIRNPLLLDGIKFDIRSYMLIASTAPYVVLHHHGYVRRSCVQYQEDCTDREAHLTNQAVQKKTANYEEIKEETVWTMEHLQEWLVNHWRLPSGDPVPADWVATALSRRMQQIMLTCFHSVRNKLDRQLGFFELLGFDFLLDENLKVWLLEININPALATNCQTLKDILPGVIQETLDLSIEIFDKARRSRAVSPLVNRQNFQLLYSEERR